jgi:hypothetical protein|nr:MAG TPA: hypothetical protein [Caudoviricetes sp.]
MNKAFLFYLADVVTNLKFSLEALRIMSLSGFIIAMFATFMTYRDEEVARFATVARRITKILLITLIVSNVFYILTPERKTILYIISQMP